MAEDTRLVGNKNKDREKVFTVVVIALLLLGFQNEPLFAESPASYSPVHAVQLAGSELKPGSLILHQGDSLPVRIATFSSYTHVAIAMPDREKGWVVYDSARKHGVRKSTLRDYLAECAGDDISLLHLSGSLKQRQCKKLRAALDEELGRAYGVSHHLTGNRATGVHCSEYVTDALIAIDVLCAKKPARVSPASLLKGILQTNIYQKGTVLKLVKPPVVPVEKKENWCSKLWNDTKTCTKKCSKKMGKMFLIGN